MIPSSFRQFRLYRSNTSITSLPDCGRTTLPTKQQQSGRKTLKTRRSRANLVDAMFGDFDHRVKNKIDDRPDYVLKCTRCFALNNVEVASMNFANESISFHSLYISLFGLAVYISVYLHTPRILRYLYHLLGQ